MASEKTADNDKCCESIKRFHYDSGIAARVLAITSDDIL